MKNPCASAHHLHITSFGRPFIALAIFMCDGPFAHIGDDFHIAVRVGIKPCIGRNAVIINDQQLPMAHFLRVKIIGKTEMMLGIKPPMIGAA